MKRIDAIKPTEDLMKIIEDMARVHGQVHT